jgi:hypothetical protein
MTLDWENIRNEEFPAANKNVQLKSGGIKIWRRIPNIQVRI